MSKKIDQEAEAKAKADAEAKAKADADAGNAGDDADKGNDEGDDKGDGSSKKEIDYDAIAAQETEARIEAEKGRLTAEALIAKNKADAKRKKEEEEDEGGDDDDKPLTRRELQSILAENNQSVIHSTQGELISKIAEELAESPAEAKAIIAVHRNRVLKGTLREQLEEAQAIVNKPRLISKNAELARALRSKETANKDASGTHRDPALGTAPKLSAVDEEAYVRAGLEFDPTDRFYKKTLPNGNIMVKDPKTKNSWIITKKRK